MSSYTNFLRALGRTLNQDSDQLRQAVSDYVVYGDLSAKMTAMKIAEKHAYGTSVPRLQSAADAASFATHVNRQIRRRKGKISAAIASLYENSDMPANPGPDMNAHLDLAHDRVLVSTATLDDLIPPDVLVYDGDGSRDACNQREIAEFDVADLDFSSGELMPGDARVSLRIASAADVIPVFTTGGPATQTVSQKTTLNDRAVNWLIHVHTAAAATSVDVPFLQNLDAGGTYEISGRAACYSTVAAHTMSLAIDGSEILDGTTQITAPFSVTASATAGGVINLTTVIDATTAAADENFVVSLEDLVIVRQRAHKSIATWIGSGAKLSDAGERFLKGCATFVDSLVESGTYADDRAPWSAICTRAYDDALIASGGAAFSGIEEVRKEIFSSAFWNNPSLPNRSAYWQDFVTCCEAVSALAGMECVSA